MRRPTQDDLSETMIFFLVAAPMGWLIVYSVYGLISALAE
jgi:hypothetical protein